MTLAFIAALTLSISPRLGIGDNAPALGFGEALKGNPVRSFSRSKPTVVEFWATWCGPCIDFMPHLSELWAKYRDRMDLVSVSVMENDRSKVKPFVAKMGDKMSYPVAIDKVQGKSKGFMYENWLKPAEQMSIPVAFIVDRQAKIAWIGHPASMEPVLQKVIDGTWDAKAYKVKHDAEMRDQEASARLMADGYGKISSTPRTHSYAATVAWIDANRRKFDGPEAQKALDEFRKLFSAFAVSDYAAALALAEAETKNGLVWTYFRPMLLVARIDALQSLKRNDWRDLATKTIDGPPDPNMLMALADAFSLPESKLADKDPVIAMKAGESAASLARVPMFLLRLAWAHHANGNLDKAKAVLDEAFQKMPEEKRRNPAFYEEMMLRLKQAKAFFEKRQPTAVQIRMRHGDSGRRATHLFEAAWGD